MRSHGAARLVRLTEAEWRENVPSECDTSPELWENIVLSEFLEFTAVNMVYVRRLVQVQLLQRWKLANLSDST